MLILDREDFSYTIYIDYIDEGYVSLEDWKDVDSKALLKEMKANCKEDVTDVQWVFEPQINEDKRCNLLLKVILARWRRNIGDSKLSLGEKDIMIFQLLKK